jgi:Ni,Fe-hydrogenase I small subunit
VITGTVPADENSTAQPAGAKTCSGKVTETAPAVVVVVPVGVCASAGATQSKVSKIFPFMFIVSLF